MTLIDQMTALKAKLQTLPDTFGVPQWQEVLLDGVAIAPKPRVVRLDSRDAIQRTRIKAEQWLNQNVMIMGDEMLIENIPRPHGDGLGYAKEALADAKYTIEGELYRPVHIDASQPLSWAVIVKPIQD